MISIKYEHSELKIPCKTTFKLNYLNTYTTWSGFFFAPWWYICWSRGQQLNSPSLTGNCQCIWFSPGLLLIHRWRFWHSVTLNSFIKCNKLFITMLNLGVRVSKYIFWSTNSYILQLNQKVSFLYIGLRVFGFIMMIAKLGRLGCWIVFVITVHGYHLAYSARE